MAFLNNKAQGELTPEEHRYVLSVCYNTGCKGLAPLVTKVLLLQSRLEALEQALACVPRDIREAVDAALSTKRTRAS
jgi:hypothetical protein